MGTRGTLTQKNNERRHHGKTTRASYLPYRNRRVNRKNICSEIMEKKYCGGLTPLYLALIDKHRHKNKSRLQTQNKGELMTTKTSAPNVGCTESDLLTPKQAAKYLGIAETTLACWRNRKHPNLVYYKVGEKSVRYRMEDLNEFLSAARIDNAQGA